MTYRGGMAFCHSVTPLYPDVMLIINSDVICIFREDWLGVHHQNSGEGDGQFPKRIVHGKNALKKFVQTWNDEKKIMQSEVGHLHNLLM